MNHSALDHGCPTWRVQSGFCHVYFIGFFTCKSKHLSQSYSVSSTCHPPCSLVEVEDLLHSYTTSHAPSNSRVPQFKSENRPDAWQQNQSKWTVLAFLYTYSLNRWVKSPGLAPKLNNDNANMLMLTRLHSSFSCCLWVFLMYFYCQLDLTGQWWKRLCR